MTGRRYVVAAGFMVAIWASPALTGELIYSPVNPSFGGNPFNSSHLLGLADRQNVHQDDPNATTATAGLAGAAGLSNDPADAFTRNLESRLLSALAADVTDAIFGDNPQDSGTVVFGDQTITFNRGLENIQLELIDNAAGTSTLIEVPTLIVEGN